MADFLKPLGLAALIALAGPAFAQDAAPAEAPAAEATPELDMGSTPNGQAAAVETYVAEVFDDWHRECVRNPDGPEVCYMAQMLRETPEAEPIGKISLRRLPDGQQAEAYGEIIMPLGVVLPQHLTVQVDTASPRVYDFRFCLPLGCIARVGFTPAEIQGFKAGSTSTVTVFAEGQPGQAPIKVEIPMGLKGFTKAYETLEVPDALAQ